MVELQRSRNRQETEERLLEAVGSLLAKGGFAALGVNAVAREAGVDKVLIYRYFGGMPELLRAFGERGQFWPTDEELIGRDPASLRAMPPSERWALLVTNAVRAIRGRPLTHEILAWEMVQDNELTRVLQDVRETQFRRLVLEFGNDVEEKEALGASVAVAIAATNYLLGRSRATTVFAGVHLHDDDSWALLERTIGRLFRESSPVTSP